MSLFIDTHDQDNLVRALEAVERIRSGSDAFNRAFPQQPNIEQWKAALHFACDVYGQAWQTAFTRLYSGKIQVPSTANLTSRAELHRVRLPQRLIDSAQDRSATAESLGVASDELAVLSKRLMALFS